MQLNFAVGGIRLSFLLRCPNLHDRQMFVLIQHAHIADYDPLSAKTHVTAAEAQTDTKDLPPQLTDRFTVKGPPSFSSFQLRMISRSMGQMGPPPFPNPYLPVRSIAHWACRDKTSGIQTFLRPFYAPATRTVYLRMLPLLPVLEAHNGCLPVPHLLSNPAGHAAGRAVTHAKAPRQPCLPRSRHMGLADIITGDGLVGKFSSRSCCRSRPRTGP